VSESEPRADQGLVQWRPDNMPPVSEVFEWRPDDMGAKLADWMTANPTLGFELAAWQRDLVEWLYKDPGDFGNKLAAMFTGPMWRGPVGTLPPIKPGRRCPHHQDHLVVIDEIVEWPYEREWALVTADRDKAEVLNRVIDGIAEDVEAKISRLQCPRFPHAE